MLAEGNFPIPLSKQEQKNRTISQKKYDAYKVKNHTQQALHIVIQKPDKQCAGSAVKPPQFEYRNSIEMLHTAKNSQALDFGL